MGTRDGTGYVIPQRYWAWLGSPRAVRVWLWLVAISIGVHHYHRARNWYADGPDTPEAFRHPIPGGMGHTQIDFGGQWVMGRMVVLGHGRELYHRQRQWEVVRAGYPQAEETPVQLAETVLPKHQRRLARDDDDVGHDADRLMSWFMGSDPSAYKTVGGAVAASLTPTPSNPWTTVALQQAAREAVTPAVVAKIEEPIIGGPLYPPIHGFLYAPLGLFDSPRLAYAVFQTVSLGLIYVAGLGICLLTRNRVWWSVASIAILMYSGGRSGLELGQNPVVSLNILVWGWVLAVRRREWLGGAIWGLLAFKPIWGVAFFLAPFLMGRWRFCLAMVGTGATLSALTLPFVGLQTWFDWLAVGREASDIYNTNQNWIKLSRDLQGIPRRFFHELNLPFEDDPPIAKQCAWALWGLVFGTTVLVYLLRADRRKPLGLGASFLFLGAFLTCYRFMYYDVLLSLICIAVLFADPWRFFRTRVFGLALVPQSPTPDRHLAPPVASPSPLGPGLVGYLNSFPLTVLAALYAFNNILLGLKVEATVGVLDLGRRVVAPDGSTAMSSPRLRADTSLSYPWDTGLLLVLWAWCAIQLVRRNERRADPAEPTTAPPPLHPAPEI